MALQYCFPHKISKHQAFPNLILGDIKAPMCGISM